MSVFLLNLNLFGQLQDLDSGVWPPSTPNIITTPIYPGGTQYGNPATWYRSDNPIVNGTFGNNGLDLGYNGTGNCAILYSNQFDGYNPFFEVDLIINNVDMSTYTAPILEFYIKHPDGGEEIEIAASNMNGPYTVLQTFSNNYSNWTLVAVDLSAYAGLPEVSLRFRGKEESSFFGVGSTNVGIDNIEISEQTNMTYISSTSSHVGCGLKQGVNNQVIMKIEVEVQGTLNPLVLNALNLNTNGSTEDINDVFFKKIYFTGTNNNFNTDNLLGTVSASGNYSINTNVTLNQGTNYFWLTCDISEVATLSNVVDAECTSLIIDGNSETPTITSPAGNISINNTGVFTVANLNDVGAGSLRNAIILASSYNCGDAIVDARGVTGTINWGNQIILSSGHKISIIGSGSGNLTISGTNEGFMYHYGNGSISFEGFQFTNFSSGVSGQSVIYKPNSKGDFHIKNCYVNSNNIRFLYMPNSPSGNLRIENCTFSNNSNISNSGVVYAPNFFDGGIYISNSTFYNNHSDELAGVMFAANISGGIYISNSTFYNNHSDEYAGVMFAANISDGLYIENCTFMNNSCVESFGGAIRAGNAPTTVINTTFENNTPNEFSGPLSMNYSHMSNTASADITGGNNIINVSGNLLPLANNGGETPTCAINAGSPLINAGTSNLDYDQRGYGRTDISDIGAFEFNGLQDNTAPAPNLSSLPDVIACSSVTSLVSPTALDDFSSTVIVTNNATLPITTTGTTVVTWTYDDGNGNTSSQTQNFIITNTVSVTPSSQINVSCNSGNNGSASVNASGGSVLTFDWTPGNPTGDGTASVTGLTPGTWICTVTNDCGDFGTHIFTITQPTLITGTDTKTECNSYTWIDGNTYTTSNNTANFNIVGGATNGCDSIVTLDLTIVNPATGTDIITACDSYTWIDGNTYTTSNNSATFTLTNGAVCDSLVTLNLTISNSNTGNDVITACDSYTWIDGNTYTANNNSATFTLTNAAGCDSLVILNLTINSVSDITTYVSGLTITANNTAATYQWLDCDNNYAIIDGELDQTFTALANRNYAVEITENGCVDTSACVALTIVGIMENNALQTISLYPNPTNGEIILQLNEYENSDVMVIVRNAIGQEIIKKNFTSSNTLNLNIEGKAGIYFLELGTGNYTAMLKVIKN